MAQLSGRVVASIRLVSGFWPKTRSVSQATTWVP
jgi:hypothetical protein